MLPSSWALSHTPWKPVVARITHRSTLRLSQRVIFNGTATRSHSTVILEAPEERSLSKPPGQTIVRNYATSSQTLQRLVEESKFSQAASMLSDLRSCGPQIHPHPVYAKAIGNLLSQRVLGAKDYEVLTIWFELLPDARSSTPFLPQGMLDDFRYHAKVDITFVIRAGRVLARKGYKTFVENEIFPLARESLDVDRFSSLEEELSQYLTDYVAQNGGHSEVFEDASEDYASIMVASTPPPPSIIELVEATLPPTLPAPEAADHSVFEDGMDEDYAVHKPISHAPPRHSPADQLLQLVRNVRYDDAFYLLNELKLLHINVPFSHDYGIVALEILRRPLSEEFTLDDQNNVFLTWISLVPLAHEASGSGSLGDIQREIMHASFTNVPLVMHFCSILVEKGYPDLVNKPELAVVMRFAQNEEVVSYIQQLEAANSSYLGMCQSENAVFQAMQFSRRIRGCAVRYLAYSGRIKEAIALLPEQGTGVKLTTFTYDKLLRIIRHTNNLSFMQYLPYIEFLREQTIDRGKQSALQRLLSEAEEKSMTAQLQMSSEDTHTGSLPETLRYLKHTLRKTESHPHPFIIVEFLQRYLSTGRTLAPTLLLNLALRTGFRSGSIFLFAEMLFYRRMNEHHLIVQTFVDHFYLSGVPREEVMKVYRDIQAHQLRHRQSHPFTPYHEDLRPSLTRICNFSPSILSHGKAWPMKIHCNLVWHALVALTPTHPKLENLYSKLRQLARGEDSFNTSTLLSPLPPLVPPPSWRHAIDHAAFTPFMRPLMQYSGVNRGSQIIQDMLDLGIQPSMYHYTEFAGFHARLGNVESALSILNVLEHDSGLLSRLNKQRRTRDAPREHQPGIATISPPPLSPLDSLDPRSTPDSSQPQDYAVPEPDIVFYASLLRGFIISKCIQGFEKVHPHLYSIQKLLPLKKFRKDQKAILDEVYDDFRILCRQQTYDWKKYRKAGWYGWKHAKRLKRDKT